jgi:hypothetical protein
MNDTQIRRITGLTGVAMALLGMASIPLYFVHSGPPPAWNVFTRNLVGLATLALLILFLCGFGHLLRRTNPASEYVASVFQNSGMLFVAVALVAVSLEVGVVFGAPAGTLDPTIDGPLAQGNMLIHGSIKRLLTAIMMVAAGAAVLHTRLVPRWLGHAAFAIAAFNFLFVPSIYFGTDPTRFYSAIGWGNSAFCASFLAYWILAVGIALLRRPGPALATSG